MTISIAILPVIAGALVLLNEGFISLSLRSASTKPDLITLPFSKESQKQFARANRFLRVFLGVISIVFAVDLTSTMLGLVLCGGLAIYVGLHAWAQFRSPEVTKPGDNHFFLYLQFTASALYGLGTVAGVVI